MGAAKDCPRWECDSACPNRDSLGQAIKLENAPSVPTLLREETKTNGQAESSLLAIPASGADIGTRAFAQSYLVIDKSRLGKTGYSVLAFN